MRTSAKRRLRTKFEHFFLSCPAESFLHRTSTTPPSLITLACASRCDVHNCTQHNNLYTSYVILRRNSWQYYWLANVQSKSSTMSTFQACTLYSNHFLHSPSARYNHGWIDVSTADGVHASSSRWNCVGFILKIQLKLYNVEDGSKQHMDSNRESREWLRREIEVKELIC